MGIFVFKLPEYKIIKIVWPLPELEAIKQMNAAAPDTGPRHPQGVCPQMRRRQSTMALMLTEYVTEA